MTLSRVVGKEKSLLAKLKNIPNLKVRTGVALNKITYWGIGGPAAILTEPSSIPQVQHVRRISSEYGIPSIVLGKGSNLFFADEGVNCVVIKLSDSFRNIDIKSDVLTVKTGVTMHHLGRIAQIAGLSGLEHATGIPGTLGGLIAMNGGSQRKSIGDIIENVVVVDSVGEVSALDREQCEFSYRDSRFLRSNEVVVEAKLKMKSSSRASVRQETLEILRQRREKFPGKEATCGSVFKSTKEMYEKHGPPGKLIELAGLKGSRSGGLVVSALHGNFFVNVGNAKARDAFSLINIARDEVENKFGVTLDAEVLYVDANGRILPATNRDFKSLGDSQL